MKCPDCTIGKKSILAHGRLLDITCPRCEGTQEVPSEMAEWINIGRAMRDERVNGGNYRTLREEAKRRGMTAQELSKMELGNIKPIPAMEDE